MASAEDPTTKPSNLFNEDEDLLDDDDDDDSEDEDSASAVDSATAQVTIAVPGVSDLHLKNQQQQLQLQQQQQLQQQLQQQQQQLEIVVAKKPAQIDEARKLFQRLWTDEDEIELLQGFLDYTTQRGGTHNPSHHHDTTAFYDQIRSKFQLDFNKNQLVEKLRRLKKKYRNVVSKFGTGKDYAFKSPHDQATFQISSRIWGNTAPPVNVNGYSTPFRPTAVDEDDDDPNNPDCQSPNPSGIDINSKTPRPRKRNRGGAIKIEEKQLQLQHAVNNNASSNHPPVPVTPAAAPAMGMGMSGSMSSVIEETVKSCLSPIFKELLGNSTSSNSNSNGMYGNGFGFALSPLPLGFAGAMGVDRMGDDKWRKQQILELEVFSKRLELVQDQINEQLQELRSIGN